LAKLCEQINRELLICDQERAQNFFNDFLTQINSRTDISKKLMAGVSDQKIRELLLCIFSASPYLSQLISREPTFFLLAIQSDPHELLNELCEKLVNEVEVCQDFDAAMKILRAFKNRMSLLIALADIAGVWTVNETMKALTKCADRILEVSVDYLLGRAAQKGDYIPENSAQPAQGSGLIVIGMGKYGAFELNYSSDIDLIIFFNASNVSLRDGIEPHMFYIRVTRELVKLLQERTADGYVFRTDLRLRPDPGATQVALSTDAGLVYYESFGKNWERAAMIKARFVAGDRVVGEDFLGQLKPFVWRNYLDFAAIAEVHAMKRQIHAYKGHGKIAVAGHNIKLGRGGIREIEFFVQTQQLIAGGRQPELRTRGTLESLNGLVDKNWIERGVAKSLSENYLFLRHLEHRLQMINDEQTHTLPDDEDALLHFARFSGFESRDALVTKLQDVLQTVQAHYSRLFEEVPEQGDMEGSYNFTGNEDDPATLENLELLGYTQPAKVSEIIRTWFSGRYASVRTVRARERLSEFLPTLLNCLADTSDPDSAVRSFDRFLGDLPSGVQLFSLLRNNPNLLRLLANMLGTTPRLAHFLTKRPKVLDAVLDPRFFGDLPTEMALGRLVQNALEDVRDFQDALDKSRQLGQEQAFLIGVRVLSGTVSASNAGGAYAALADRLITSLKSAAEADLSRVHGVMDGGGSAVVALGKLGGREMTASSDLDLIVVYEFDENCVASDGQKPLSGMQYFTRLTQRLIAALSSPTAEGTLYEVDMRLRPSGRAGPVATHINSFSEYHEKQAWTWEHMALTRARVIAADQPLKSKIETIIHDVLTRAHDPVKLASDIVEMRSRMEQERGTENIWHLKNVRGGLIDLEFISQYLQLLYAHDAPEVLDCNTLSALKKLSRAQFLNTADAEILISAAKLYHNLTQILRLGVDESFDPDIAPDGLKKLLMDSVDAPDFSHLEVDLKSTLSRVQHLFDEIITARTV